MKHAFNLLSLIVIVSFIIGCISPKDKITCNVKALAEKPISIPYNQMLCWKNNSRPEDSQNAMSKLKLVTVFLIFSNQKYK